MNSEKFLHFINNNRDCKMEKLDLAVVAGLRRGKNDWLQPGKFITLAVACVFTFAVCVIINLTPVGLYMEGYYKNWHGNMPGSSEILNGYIIDITYSLKKHLGGEL